MIWTWPMYAAGALYIAGPVLGWLLGGLAALSLYLGKAMRPDLRAEGAVPPVVLAWIAGMFAMLLILVVGHMNWNFSPAQTLKSGIGWAKGWALMALFPLAGAVLPIRRELLVRSQCIVGLWILVIAPVLLAAPYLGLPQKIFVSPLQAVGGPGPEYFTVFLYTIDPASMAPRWQFYAPWSPFAALLGVIMVLFAFEETDRRWLTAGLLGGLIMVLASQSRMGLAGLVVCPLVPRMLSLLPRSWAWRLSSAASVVAAILADRLIASASTGIEAAKNARANSTRVRSILQEIAVERWQNEALWFGHGRVAPGAHIVEFMPIGSHHTWYGLLFVKGALGFLALLLPFLWQAWLSVTSAIRGKHGNLPCGILLVFLILSLGENIEIEAYMLWPGMLILGIHAKELHSQD